MAVKGFRLKVHSEGAKAILESAGVVADLERRGKAVAEAAGGADDFEVRTERRHDRPVVFVRTASIDGMRAEAKDRSLTRAIDAGR